MILNIAGFDSLDKASNILAHMPGKFVTGQLAFVSPSPWKRRTVEFICCTRWSGNSHASSSVQTLQYCRARSCSTSFGSAMPNSKIFPLILRNRFTGNLINFRKAGRRSAAFWGRRLLATLSLRFCRGRCAPFTFLCLLGFPGPNHLRVAGLVHGNLP